MMRLACPAASSGRLNPPGRFAGPSRKSTVPVAGAPAAVKTVAVNVTGWPKNEGFAEELTVVVVSPVFISCVNTADTLDEKLVLPLYRTVMGWTPRARFAVAKVAWPVALRGTLNPP